MLSHPGIWLKSLSPYNSCIPVGKILLPTFFGAKWYPCHRSLPVFRVLPVILLSGRIGKS